MREFVFKGTSFTELWFKNLIQRIVSTRPHLNPLLFSHPDFTYSSVSLSLLSPHSDLSCKELFLRSRFLNKFKRTLLPSVWNCSKGWLNVQSFQRHTSAALVPPHSRSLLAWYKLCKSLLLPGYLRLLHHHHHHHQHCDGRSLPYNHFEPILSWLRVVLNFSKGLYLIWVKFYETWVPQEKQILLLN